MILMESYNIFQSLDHDRSPSWPLEPMIHMQLSSILWINHNPSLNKKFRPILFISIKPALLGVELTQLHLIQTLTFYLPERVGSVMV